jgi:hypothetical protein
MTDATCDGPISGDDLWDVARQLYDAGYTGKMICEDLGLAPTTFWRRARQENWLRRDRRVAPPEPLDMEAPVQEASDAADLAWRRMTQALEAGRAVEAMRWRRLHAELVGGEARADSRQRRQTRERMDELSDRARLIERHAAAALGVKRLEDLADD